MIAFVTIGTNDLKSSSEFYDKILLPFSIVQVDSGERYIGYANIDNPIYLSPESTCTILNGSKILS
jgi:hypothetical protein